MKSLLIPLFVILSCVIGFSSCNNQHKFVDNSENTSTSAIIPPDWYLNKDDVQTLLKNNTQLGKTIEVCKPVYFMQFNAEQMSLCHRELMPFDTVIFPVLEDKKIVGFVMYQYQDETFNQDEIFSNPREDENLHIPRFMPISDEAYKKLKKRHSLKIAMVQWKQGNYYLDYVYFSDDNEVGFLWDFDISQTPPKIQFEYETLTELQSFDLKSLEVIMTFENE